MSELPKMNGDAPVHAPQRLSQEASARLKLSADSDHTNDKNQWVAISRSGTP
jgi:hypothetical protein